MIRIFDLIFSFIGLLVLSPFLLLIAIWIKFDSRGPVFYRQTRVGLNGIDFKLLKFRSMFLDSDKGILITVGNRDERITKSGFIMRKFKLDELPQLVNVFLGEMSLVGPRPEVRKYVELYSPEQMVVLTVKPGITDYASIEYKDENKILSTVVDPEKYYIQYLIPVKIELNMKFIHKRNLAQYFKILFLTICNVFFPNNSKQN